jgi:hypothetical protein
MTTGNVSLKVVLTIIFLMFGLAVSNAQDMMVPIDIQVPLFLKILSFDRNFTARAGDEVVVGVVYQKKFRNSVNVKDEVMDVITKSPIKDIQNIPVRFVPVELEEGSVLDSVFTAGELDIIYVTPLRALGMDVITRWSRQLHITTITGVEDYVEAGLAVGIGIKGDKPQIIINLPAAREEGMNFTSQLLKLARILE